jgi:glycosyltransferase involved in cell wall biosynthesis
LLISFIIPAHDEEALIGRTLSAIHDCARGSGEAYEIVVADDASTDRTAAVAREHGARVMSIGRRQIAAARNAGARAAAGDVFVFVDADTAITLPALRAALAAIRAGAVGGGCEVRFEGKLPPYAVLMERLLPPLLRALRMAPGCFLFCTRAAYFAAGGYDESLYITEEVAFARRLQRLGRFVMLREFVITSARKLRVRTASEMLLLGVRLALRGPQAMRQRDGLDYWYGSRNA